jgi:L,D-transpeptidase ErfK/SrfK
MIPAKNRLVPRRAVLPRAIAVALVGVLASGCQSWLARLRHEPVVETVSYDEETFATKRIRAYAIPGKPPKKGAPENAVIGQAGSYRVRNGDTLLDIARYNDLGYNEIVEANPGMDPWLPPVGENVVLPTSWVLPCCSREGIVMNIPEMRLYYYHREAADAPMKLVITHPVGIGRVDWRTPLGQFKVRGKTENPTWTIPQSIRKERIAERGDDRRMIAGGDPENPLGNHRIELTVPSYIIHGTNKPWGVGRQVSHGCARLYPEDIERLFPLVDVGTPVEFTYQPVKFGTQGRHVFIEVHPDIYGYEPLTYQEALGMLKRRGLAEDVDEALLKAALKNSRGMPVRISR